MVVLRIRQRRRIRAERFTDSLEAEGGQLVPFAVLVPALTHLRAFQRNSLTQHRVAEAELAVQLERPRVNDHGARVLARTGGPRDDTRANASARETQGEGKAGRAGTGDQYGKRISHGRSRRGVSTTYTNTPRFRRRTAIA